MSRLRGPDELGIPYRLFKTTIVIVTLRKHRQNDQFLPQDRLAP